MKKFLLLGLSLFTIVACNNNDKEYNLILTGNIKGLSKGKLYIQKIQDANFVVIDSIEINGTSDFEIGLNIPEPEMLYLSLDRGQSNSLDNNLPFFAEPGKINIESTLNGFFVNAKITGSKNQELLEKFNSINNKFNDENLLLFEKKANNKNANSQEFKDSIKAAFERLQIRKYRYTTNFAVTNGEHEIAPYLAVSEIADINTAILDTIQKHLSPKVVKSKYGKMLDEHIKTRKASE
jgi:hypothetical protein